MMVGILQCINDDESWLYVGGSGDGGVDGLAVNMEGEISAILQCKWKHDGGDIEIGAIEFEGKRILASLLHPPNINFPNTQVFYGIDEIADLVLKHQRRLRRDLKRNSKATPRKIKPASIKKTPMYRAGKNTE